MQLAPLDALDEGRAAGLHQVILLSGPGISSIAARIEENSCAVPHQWGVDHDMWAVPTSTPWWATSRRSALAKCSTPALARLQHAEPAIGAYAASDDTTRT